MTGSNEICAPSGENFTCGCLTNYVWNDTDKKCDGETIRTDCENIITANSHYSGDNSDGKFEQQWNGTIWEPAASGFVCAWECDTDYDLDGSVCIDEKSVQCDEKLNPPHSTNTIGDVIINYTTSDGWEDPAGCKWTCDKYYVVNGGGDACDETEFAGGDGSDVKPYQVATTFHLNNVRNYLTAHFLQIEDIYLEDYLSLGGDQYNDGEGWEPIGDDIKKFTGHYNGDGFIIGNLIISRETENFIGLFGYLDAANIENVRIMDAEITGKGAVGCLAGRNGGSISQCSCIGKIAGENQVGGLIGLSQEAKEYDSYALGSVKAGTDYAGGLIGFKYLGETIWCYAAVRVGSTGTAGGFIAYNNGGTIEICYFDKDVAGTSFSAGGTGFSTSEMKYSYGGTWTPPTSGTGPYYKWDFDNVWDHDKSGDVNDYYPYLRY